MNNKGKIFIFSITIITIMTFFILCLLVFIITNIHNSSSSLSNDISYAPFGVYWRRDLWKSTIIEAYGSYNDLYLEDFEDIWFNFEIRHKYVSKKGLQFTGFTKAEISDGITRYSKNALSITYENDAIIVSFPKGKEANYFGFDFVSPITWYLLIGNQEFKLEPTEIGFVGVVFERNKAEKFVLIGIKKGFIIIDNIYWK